MRTGLAPCYCGHSIEEHRDDHFPGSSACGADDCECVAYEEDGDTQRDLDRYDEGSRRNSGT